MAKPGASCRLLVDNNNSCNSNVINSATAMPSEFAPETSKSLTAKQWPDGQIGYPYWDYMQLDKLLSCNRLLSYDFSVDGKSGVHDEHFFKIMHQTSELWFQQIIWDVDSIRNMLSQQMLPDDDLLRIIHRLRRVVSIWQLLVQQIGMLELLSPQSYMQFRHYLSPASGFQSLQFRLIENKLGQLRERRIAYNKQHYDVAFWEADMAEQARAAESEPTLFSLINAWLERCPLLLRKSTGGVGEDFVTLYELGVANMERDMKQNAACAPNEAIRHAMHDQWTKQYEAFEHVLQPERYKEYVNTGARRLSHGAFQAALMITVYRDVPVFSQPYQVIELIMELETAIMNWRHVHAQMAQRMIGSKLGTGGSSGYTYLRATIAERYKSFGDFFALPTYMIPNQFLPKWSDNVCAE